MVRPFINERRLFWCNWFDDAVPSGGCEWWSLMKNIEKVSLVLCVFFLFWGWCLNGRSSQVIKPHTFNFYLQCMYLHFKTHICPHFFFWQCKNYNFWVTIIGFSLTIFLVHLLKKKKGKKFVIDLCCTEGTYCSEILWLLLLNLFSFPLPSPPRSSWGFPEFCIALGG